MKYTELGEQTGITKHNQSLLVNTCAEDRQITHRGDWVESFLDNGLRDITNQSIAFVKERNWEMHDTIMNLTLAVCSEVGEVADVVAWSGDNVGSEDTPRLRDKMAQELADVTIILVRLADVLGVTFVMPTTVPKERS